MSSYYANHDLDAYADQLANYEQEEAVWRANVDVIRTANAEAEQRYQQAYADYEQQHAAWEAASVDEAGNPIPEPQPPTQPPAAPEPDPPSQPSPPAMIYDAHEVDAPEQITTATGPALVLPGRTVLSGDGGATAFALTPDELAASFTLVSEPLPLARQR